MHAALPATPVQLVFGRDAVSNVKFEADWKAIKERKQALMNENDTKENEKQIPHTCRVRDKILLENRKDSECGNDPHSDPV